MQIVKINLRFLVREKHLSRILEDEIFAFHGIREVVRRAEIYKIWILVAGTAPRYRRQDAIEPLDTTREGRCRAATSGSRAVVPASQVRGGDTQSEERKTWSMKHGGAAGLVEPRIWPPGRDWCEARCGSGLTDAGSRGALAEPGYRPCHRGAPLVHGELWVGDGSCGSLGWGWAEPVGIGEHGR